MNPRGGALLSALLLVAFCASLIVFLIQQQRIYIQLSSDYFDSIEAYHRALGVETWAIGQIMDLKKLASEEQRAIAIDSRLEPTPIKGGVVAGRILDAQSLVDVNSIFRGKDDRIKRLISLLDTPFEQDDIDRLLQGAWGFRNGAQDIYQEGFKYPKQIFRSPTELRLLFNVNPDLVEELIPHLVALPARVDNNLWTASKMTLQANSELITDEYADVVLQFREENQDNLDKAELAQLVDGGVFLPYFKESSDYYYSIADVTVNDVHLILYTLIEFRKNNIRIVARHRHGI